MTRKIEGGHGAPRCQLLLKNHSRQDRRVLEGRKDPPSNGFVFALFEGRRRIVSVSERYEGI